MKKTKFIAPLLSLAVLFPSAANVFAEPDKRVSVEKVEFIGMDAPDTAEERSKMYSEAAVLVTYDNGSQRTLPLEYKSLFRPGDVINGTTAGAAYDADGNMIKSPEGKPYISTSPDSNTLIDVHGNLYMVNHYESMPSNTIGNMPKSMMLNTVVQNQETGQLTVTDTKPIDFSADGGIWTPCAGSLSPWNTHLGSEEYEPDAKEHEANPEKSAVTQFARNYYQDDTILGNPYLYGHTPEVTVHADGTATAVKHYSMGRLSSENVKAAPDNRTVYYGDDGSYTMSFMYVADKAKDLSSGTLYAAKWIQTSADNGGTADLQWIKLGHANDAEIKQIAEKVKFSDIFETTADAEYAKANGFTRTKAGGRDEWLKLKPGMEKAAAFLESRRYGALLGATAEFNKMETVELNEADNKMYVTMSTISGGMTANTMDPADDIQVSKVNSGGIYQMSLADGQLDRDGNKIKSKYVADTMTGLVFGKDLPAKDAAGNTSDPERISNPDNIVFSEKLRTLFIAEDGGRHHNNYGWAYNIDTGKLSRIISAPDGGEVTGVQFVDDLNGFTYLMVESQNPGNAGYISGLPSLAKTDNDDNNDENHGINNNDQR
ncbi:PhoX family protein [Cohnella kolymensis]|uniref:PhoX family protein n=1 Tax=Cohnella kolymensis TaxID=1590652 RepID=UPI0009E1B770|nr:alkaline phosphatase PhoX [Cohnella kolymensis]